jgi:hypothetical protein
MTAYSEMTPAELAHAIFAQRRAAAEHFVAAAAHELEADVAMLSARRLWKFAVKNDHAESVRQYLNALHDDQAAAGHSVPQCPHQKHRARPLHK